MSGINISDLVREAGETSRAALDAVVARRVWAACAELGATIDKRLHAVQGHGCEAASQRAYLLGQYELLVRDIWPALQLPVPPQFATITASMEGREDMTEPEETAAAEAVEAEETEAAETDDAAEAAADEADAGDE